MRLARLVICLLAISAGAGAALALLPRAVKSLHSLTVPTLTLPTTTTPVSATRSSLLPTGGTFPADRGLSATPTSCGCFRPNR